MGDGLSFEELRLRFTEHLKERGHLAGLSRCYLHNRFRMTLDAASYERLEPHAGLFRAAAAAAYTALAADGRMAVTPGLSLRLERGADGAGLRIESETVGPGDGAGLFRLTVTDADGTRGGRLVFADALYPEQLLDLRPELAPAFDRLESAPAAISRPAAGDGLLFHAEPGTDDRLPPDRRPGAGTLVTADPGDGLRSGPLTGRRIVMGRDLFAVYSGDAAVVAGAGGHLPLAGSGITGPALLLRHHARQGVLYGRPLPGSPPVAYAGVPVDRTFRLSPGRPVTVGDQVRLELTREAEPAPAGFAAPGLPGGEAVAAAWDRLRAAIGGQVQPVLGRKLAPARWGIQLGAPLAAYRPVRRFLEEEFHRAAAAFYETHGLETPDGTRLRVLLALDPELPEPIHVSHRWR